ENEPRLTRARRPVLVYVSFAFTPFRPLSRTRGHDAGREIWIVVGNAKKTGVGGVNLRVGPRSSKRLRVATLVLPLKCAARNTEPRSKITKGWVAPLVSEP